MALIEFVCPQCGYVCEELVRADGKYPDCPECGAPLAQKYSGKCYCAKTGGGSSCSGNCATCKGCH